MIAVPVLVAILAIVAFFVGIFDRPAFVYHDSILSSSDAAELVTIVAVSTNKDISGTIDSLLQAAKSAILASPDGARLMQAAAVAYAGSDEGTHDKLSLGLYFDDPTLNSNPRWGTGYAVQTDYKQARLIAAQGAAATGMGEGIIKVVRVPNTRILKCSVPWRSFLTPMIAPLVHWPRIMNKYKSDHDDVDAALAIEIYNTKTIDYIAYPDASVPLEDAFGTSEQAPQETPAQHVDEQGEEGERIMMEEQVPEQIPVERDAPVPAEPETSEQAEADVHEEEAHLEESDEHEPEHQHSDEEHGEHDHELDEDEHHEEEHHEDDTDPEDQSEQEEEEDEFDEPHDEDESGHYDEEEHAEHEYDEEHHAAEEE